MLSSSTHLMNEALRRVVGEHVYQQGSRVGSDNFHFDFNHYALLTASQIIAIEDLVNQQIQAAHSVVIKEMPLSEAKEMNVQAVFGEKYGDIVRVVNMDFSKELCGGCHVRNTKDIKQFVILSVESKGSGIYRIEATSGTNAEYELQKTVVNIVNEIDDLRLKIHDLNVKAAEEKINFEVSAIPRTPFVVSYRYIVKLREESMLLREQLKELEKHYVKFKKDAFVIDLDSFLNQVINIQSYRILITKTAFLEIDHAKDAVDRFADKLGESLIFFANLINERLVFICKSKIAALHAGNLVKMAATFTNGNGGGKSDFAQAGGKDLSKVDDALVLIKQEVVSKL